MLERESFKKEAFLPRLSSSDRDAGVVASSVLSPVEKYRFYYQIFLMSFSGRKFLETLI